MQTVLLGQWRGTTPLLSETNGSDPSQSSSCISQESKRDQVRITAGVSIPSSTLPISSSFPIDYDFFSVPSPTKQKLQHSICWLETAELKFNPSPSPSVVKTNRICILIKTSPLPPSFKLFSCSPVAQLTPTLSLARELSPHTDFCYQHTNKPWQLKASSFQSSQLHWRSIWPTDQTSSAVSAHAIPPLQEEFSLFAKLTWNATQHFARQNSKVKNMPRLVKTQCLFGNTQIKRIENTSVATFMKDLCFFR